MYVIENLREDWNSRNDMKRTALGGTAIDQ